MINDLTDIIQREGLPYKDTIIIGNNSSGKSELIKNLLQKLKKIAKYTTKDVLKICERIYINYQLRHVIRKGRNT